MTQEIQQIKAEIERLYKEAKEEPYNGRMEGRLEVLDKLDAFIDSLEEELKRRAELARKQKAEEMKTALRCRNCVHYIEIKTSIYSTDQQIYTKPQTYTITNDGMLALYDGERAELMKLSKEELIEKLIGKREEVGMTFI